MIGGYQDLLAEIYAKKCRPPGVECPPLVVAQREGAGVIQLFKSGKSAGTR